MGFKLSNNTDHRYPPNLISQKHARISNMAAPTFKPALIIVDLQEDFCPPNGTLAVDTGRAIIPTVNHLLGLPFALKIATKDWHPADHISFASSHPDKKPFVNTVTIVNPYNASETYETRLWPRNWMLVRLIRLWRRG